MRLTIPSRYKATRLVGIEGHQRGVDSAANSSDIEDAVKVVDLLLTAEERNAPQASYQPCAIFGHMQPSAARMVNALKALVN